MITSEKIEAYIVQHLDDEPSLLNELNRQTHLRTPMPRMLSGHWQGRMLKMLCSMIKPRNVLEIGTFTGYSALCMAEALQADAQLHTVEINDEWAHIARQYIEKSDYKHRIHLHIGNAIDIISSLNTSFDLVFIDADKRQYSDYYHAVFPYVPSGGFLLADNVLWSGKVIQPLAPNDEDTKAIIEFNNMVTNDQRVEKVILPIRDGIMLIRKK